MSAARQMQQGDFTDLAQDYIHRTGYSHQVLKALYGLVLDARGVAPAIADVGAGTGKLTTDLAVFGRPITCVEPNDAMRTEGIRQTSTHKNVSWRAGSAESTGLATASCDWVLMGSSFHWTKPQVALSEFERALRPNGFFTALWNPRNLDSDPLQQKVEEIIRRAVPNLQRVSSGSKEFTTRLHETLLESGRFTNLLFMEASYRVEMTRERYLGAWRSVNDVRAQAGERRFEEIMRAIEAELGTKNVVSVPYKTRAWSVQRKD